jgi:type II restriction/modification system DNA methylase subunit YeeA
VLELDSDGLRVLMEAAALDWSSIEPSIFGALFERSLDPDKRSQLGAHYTSKEDILLVVEPVLMSPLRRRWNQVQARARELAALRAKLPARVSASRIQRDALQKEIDKLLRGFAEEIAHVQVLDPACGSGNFLYVALRQLLDLWKEVYSLLGELGSTFLAPTSDAAPYPTQLHGIEINPYAYELAQATIWIGYIQWMRENGFGFPGEPILRPMETIKQMDAILAYDANGQPAEPDWPQADVIIGNPPFLGGNKIRQELGDEKVEALFALYEGRVPALADLVCYWFEKARAMIEVGKTKRVGLLATQGIRGGANRKLLEHIKQTGSIFWAQSDRDWILDGATVHVSMIGFDDGIETTRLLDDQPVASINADLTATVDMTQAKELAENQGIAFRGNQKGGPFDIPEELAHKMLQAPINPNGQSNERVVRPWVNGVDITRQSRRMWLIDFGTNMTLEEAALYELPFEYVKAHVYPVRKDNNRKAYRERWWIHAEARPSMRAAIAPLTRYIVTPHVSKHRIFVWLNGQVIPDHELVVFARKDDYFFGVLHSKFHELWARGTGTQLREVESGFRYTPTTTFETFPFPWPPGREPKRDPRVKAIAQAARELVQQRDAWLNPSGATEAELKKRTLTNLYNQRPTWLDLAHRKLDEAVFDAYGQPHDIGDEEILARLLALNLERAKK